MAGDLNPRWRVDNILTLGLDTSDLKTTFSKYQQSPASYDSIDASKSMESAIGQQYRDTPLRTYSTGLSSGPLNKLRAGLTSNGVGSALGSEDFDYYRSVSEDLSSSSNPSSNHPSNVALDTRLSPSRDAMRSLASSKQLRSS